MRLLKKDPYARLQAAAELLPVLARVPGGDYPLPHAVVRSGAQRDRTRVTVHAPRLHGRESLIGELAHQDRPQGAFLLTGMSGSGRTRMLDELNALQERAGGRTLRLEFRVGDRRPFGPIADCGVPLVEIVRETRLHELRDDLYPLVAAVSRVFPTLAELDAVKRLAAGPGPSLSVAPIDALADLLARLAAVEPLLVLADDVDRAAGPALRFLERLGHQCSESLGLVVAASERDRVPLSGALRSLRHERLETLSLGSIGRLIESMVGEEAPPESLDLIGRITDGNPGAVEELVRALVGRGLIARGATGLWDSAGLSTTLERAVSDAGSSLHEAAATASRLPQSARQLLQAIAWLARDVTFEWLVSVSKGSEDLVLDDVELLLKGRLLREVSGESRLEIASERVSGQALAGITRERERELAAAWIRTLATASGRFETANLAAIAAYLPDSQLARDYHERAESELQLWLTSEPDGRS